MGSRMPIEPWLSGCDLLIAPAIDEPFGRTLVEAAMVGTPVIATDDHRHRRRRPSRDHRGRADRVPLPTDRPGGRRARRPGARRLDASGGDSRCGPHPRTRTLLHGASHADRRRHVPGPAGIVPPAMTDAVVDLRSGRPQASVSSTHASQRSAMVGGRPAIERSNASRAPVRSTPPPGDDLRPDVDLVAAYDGSDGGVRRLGRRGVTLTLPVPPIRLHGGVRRCSTSVSARHPGGRPHRRCSRHPAETDRGVLPGDAERATPTS
jgi:hypothetical protein